MGQPHAHTSANGHYVTESGGLRSLREIVEVRKSLAKHDSDPEPWDVFHAVLADNRGTIVVDEITYNAALALLEA